MASLTDSLVNLSHLDHLGQTVEHRGGPIRIVHIYAEPPDYNHKADPEEGTACVDDAARAAIVYLRHFETTRNTASREKAEALLRFVMYMQTQNGLFYNFVFNDRLDINRTHLRSHAESFEWWSARAIWALGTGARALAKANPPMADACVERIERSCPHVEQMLANYPQTEEYRGRTIPTWLIHGDHADATSELLLGLAALHQARPDAELHAAIVKLAEGIAMMRYGSMGQFPFGAHASNRDEWHGYGNSQTQALAEAGRLISPKLEAEHFYPRLIVEGILHSVTFDDLHGVRYYARIAYGIRCVAVGLVRLFEATGDARYAAMAGLAASWFTGANDSGRPMYDPATGHGYDGLMEGERINYNAGAESTIEALHAILEVEQHEPARRWLFARKDTPDPVRTTRNGTDYFFRVFNGGETNPQDRIAIIMDLTHEKLDVLDGPALDSFLNG
jgi:hypothetical protein